MLALLLETTLKGSLILALAAACTTLMRRRSAAARHLVWAAALLSAALLPLGTRLLPAWRVTLPMEVRASLADPVFMQAATQRLTGEPDRRTETATRSPVARLSAQPSDRPAGPRFSISLPVVLTLGWTLTAAMLLARLLAGLGRMARVTQRAVVLQSAPWQETLQEAAASVGLRRSVQVLASEETMVPLTWGLIRPVVLLPPDHEEWSSDRRRAVLIHELAHVARWDYATQLAAQLCCALYWFNPLVWLGARGLRSERERACDDRVLAAGTRASAYAGELLEIARTALGRDAPAVALAMARRSELEGRLLCILNPGIRREAPRARSAAMLVVAAMILALPLAAFRPGPAPARQPATEPSVSSIGQPPAQPTARVTALDSAPSSLARGARSPSSSPERRAATPNAPGQGIDLSTSPCDVRKGKTDHSHSSSNWSDSGNKSWRVSWSDNGCSVDLVAKGDIEFNADFSDVTDISPGGYLEITIREGESTRRLEVRPQGGTLRRIYSVDGTAAPFDAAARAWLAAFLIDLDRHTAFAVESRFPALLKQGVSAVLDEIDQMPSDYARGVYYKKLLTAAKLTPAEVQRVARSAGDAMESDYELGRVLAALAERYSLAEAEVRTAFIDAAGTLQSDYERAQLLLVVIAKGAVAPEAGRTIVKLAGGMTSDYEKARVLMALGDSRLIDRKAAAPDYLDAVAGMKSDYERGRVLQLIVNSGQLSKESLLRVFDVLSHMESDYEAANVLVAVASHNQLDGQAKDAYFKAADRLKSNYESQRARAALRAQ